MCLMKNQFNMIAEKYLRKRKAYLFDARLFNCPRLISIIDLHFHPNVSCPNNIRGHPCNSTLHLPHKTHSDEPRPSLAPTGIRPLNWESTFSSNAGATAREAYEGLLAAAFVIRRPSPSRLSVSSSPGNR